MNAQTLRNHLNFVTENKNSLLTFLGKALLFSLLIAISAQITVPAWPIPMTLQPTAVMVIGLITTPSIAVASVVAYIIEGACGLPVFHAFKSGLPHLFNTTGGYIFGFLPLVFVISSLKDKSQSFAYRFGVCLLGSTALYICGISYLSLFVGFDKAIQLGFLPFFPKTIVSIAFAILSANLIRKIRI